jgi:hypothetical protein
MQKYLETQRGKQQNIRPKQPVFRDEIFYISIADTCGCSRNIQNQLRWVDSSYSVPKRAMRGMRTLIYPQHDPRSIHHT